MKGWKTVTAAVLSIGYGAAGWWLGLHGPDVAMQFVVQGLGLVGIGHKLEKLAAPSIFTAGPPVGAGVGTAPADKAAA